MAASMDWKCLLLLSCFVAFSEGQIELGERFHLERGTGTMWLIEFYAPWCGHCKKLEPIFREVAFKLRSSSVKVGKLDCTRYPHVATEFGVKGFPTIMFISGDYQFTHRGDRTVQDITEFALRAQGPTLRNIASPGRLNEIKLEHYESAFFLFIEDKDPEDDSIKKYESVANDFLTQTYFYYGSEKILPSDVTLKKTPTVLVFKDHAHYEFEAPNGVITYEALKDWVRKERLSALPTVSGAGLNEIADCGKILVIVVDAKDDSEERMKTMAFTLTTEYTTELLGVFQFVVMEDTESVNAITMSFSTGPSVLVLDPATQLYYTPPSLEAESFGELEFRAFLHDVREGRIPPQGGLGFLIRVQRIAYDLISTLLGIWQASRWLFALMFGLPTVIISVICYSLCCMEPIDDESLTDDDMEDDPYTYDASKESNHPKAE